MRKLLDLGKIIRKYDVKIIGVIHIGAHFGKENRIYEALGIPNRMFFEPSDSSFPALKARIGDSFPVIKKALGNENKKVTMYVEKENKGQSNSLLKPVAHLVQYPWIKFDETEEVEMARLDDLGIDFSKYNFISIDVQGYELEVFKGAAESLKHIDYIISEINRDEIYENCARVEQLMDFLAPYGFVLSEESWAGGEWGDGFFIKRRIQ